MLKIIAKPTFGFKAGAFKLLPALMLVTMNEKSCAPTKRAAVLNIFC